MRRGLILVVGLAALLVFVLRLVLHDQPTRSAGRASRRFVGTTSQKQKIRLRVSGDRHEIERIDVTYVADCLDGSISMQLSDTLYTPVRVRPDGSFGADSLGERLSIHGTIAHGASSGTLTIDMRYGGFMACSTKKLRWTAVATSA